VDADRRRADDYYLAEGTGIARRYTIGGGRVEELAPLTYEAVRQDPTLINLRDL
jgi:exodeoxyribonuclease V alpha subunit